jgi:hypothetical protein
MNQLTKSWINATLSSMLQVQRLFSKNKGAILTEGDLECYLFQELMKQPALCGFHTTKDNILDEQLKGKDRLSTFVHSQVTWFKPQKKSGFEVDLTIGAPEFLDTYNLDFFEDHPSKGFAYDGPCVAIELKFIRSKERASQHGPFDFLKLLNDLIPGKIKNIEDGLYKRAKFEDLGFISIVGCKDKESYSKAKFYIGKQLQANYESLPKNLFVWLFSSEEICTSVDEFIPYYNEFDNLPEGFFSYIENR